MSRSSLYNINKCMMSIFLAPLQYSNTVIIEICYLFVGYDHITSKINFTVFGELVKSNCLRAIIELR